jgi:hypothetical protein
MLLRYRSTKQTKESLKEFYLCFLAKKTQFKAKEILLHRLNIDQVSLNPSHQLTACLWHCDFLWITPDLRSGVSIFFCLEISSLTQKI